MCVRLVRGHPRPGDLVARRVSVAVSVGSVAVSMGAVSVPVAVPSVPCIPPDVCAVGQGLHVDRSIAESDSRG